LIPYDSGIDTYRYRKLGISAKPVLNTSCPKFKFASFLNYNFPPKKHQLSSLPLDTH
jgi:hypothetical protein